MPKPKLPPVPRSDEVFGDAGSEAAQRLLSSALRVFAAKGFHAATTREIGDGAGMSPASVYVHYKAKTDLLFAISRSGHLDCLRAVESALAMASDDPVDRVHRFIGAFAHWHAEHHLLARVAQYELNALSAEQFRELAKLRRRFDDHLRRELQQGIDAGVFEVRDLAGTTTAALSLCIDIARWYGPRRGREPQQTAKLYADLVIRMVRRPGPRSVGARQRRAEKPA
jgi:AcrR family transcriptional regulator